jgi:hypothetical protein
MSPHLYQGSARYKCKDNTFVPSGTTTRNKCEAFVPGGEEEALPRPCEWTFVLGGVSYRYKCSHLYQAKIPGTNEESTQGQMPDSLVMVEAPMLVLLASHDKQRSSR